MLDEEGYPTEEFLEAIKKFDSIEKDIFEFIKPYWKYANQGYWTQEVDSYHLSTGGWSGNEEIIRALQDNFIFWSIWWQSSTRGGHFVFKKIYNF